MLFSTHQTADGFRAGLPSGPDVRQSPFETGNERNGIYKTVFMVVLKRRHTLCRNDMEFLNILYDLDSFAALEYVVL